MFVLTIAVMISLFSYKSSAFQVSDDYHMKDISQHWAQKHINELVYMEILKGYNQNSNPNNKITRAEFMSLLVKALELEEYSYSGKSYFSDVKPEAWYYKAVTTAYGKGIVRGYGDGTFLPDKLITREEIVITIVRALNLDYRYTSTSRKFKDIKSYYPYKSELDAAIQSGIINGYGDNTFRPKNNALRSEAAVMIRKMMDIDIEAVNRREQEEIIKNLISSYMNEYLKKKNKLQSDIEFNMMHSIGKARDDNTVRSEVIELLSEKGLRVVEEIQNADIKVNEISGSTAKARVNYDVKYTRLFEDSSTRIKDYKGEKTFSLRKLNGSWKVYNVEERLYRSEKINMVWEQVAVKTPAMTGVQPLKGLNIISPTWFELRKASNKLGVKATDPVVYRDSKGKIHMIDMGDKDYIEWAHQNGYDVWGLFRNEFDIDIANKVLNSKKSRKEIIGLLVGYTEKYRLDGINVDFENVYYNDRSVLTQFVRELALVMREQGLVTSVDITKIEPTSWNWSMCYDRRALGEAADYLALMAYDQNGDWSKQSGSVAQLNWVEKGLREVLEQVPREKMILGLPFYTRLWEEEKGRVVDSSPVSMQTAQRLVRENNARVTWDNTSGQYFAVYTKGNKTYKIWLEDVRSINLKSSLVHKYKLAGAAGWRRGYETADIWSILDRNLNLYVSYEEWASNNKEESYASIR